MTTRINRKRILVQESLAARLILVMGGLVIGTALVLSALAVSLLGTALETNARGRLDTARDYAADAISQRVTDSASLARILQGDPGLLALIRTPTASADNFLARVGRARPTADVLLVSSSGARLVSTRSAAKLDAQPIFDALRTGQPVNGLTRTPDCQVLALSAQLVGEGADNAVLVIIQPLDDAFVAHLKSVSGTNAWVVCGSAEQASAAGAQNLELDKDLLHTVMGQGSMALGSSRVDGVADYGYYVPLFDWHGAAIGVYGVAQPVQVVNSARDNVAGIFFVVVIVFSALVLSEVYVLARSITRPLRRLTDATRALGEGDLQTPLAVTGHDEIGVLSSSFETMRVRLATTVAELERERNRYREFLALMPHEFKTPLAALSASLELLESDSDTMEVGQQRLLASLRRSIIRLTSLVDNLLDTASIQAGKFTVAAEPHEIGAIIEDAVQTTDLLLDQKNQTLEVRLEPGLPPVMADPRRITQVLVNLITNAHKYGPPEGIIRVAVTRRDESMHIAVSDRGPGISASDQRGLFQRFIRASSSDANERGGVSGVGVGLAIVREIVTLHHGQVGLESEPDKGTTVWFTLPLALQAVKAPFASEEVSS